MNYSQLTILHLTLQLQSVLNHRLIFLPRRKLIQISRARARARARAHTYTNTQTHTQSKILNSLIYFSLFKYPIGSTDGNKTLNLIFCLIIFFLTKGTP